MKHRLISIVVGLLLVAGSTYGFTVYMKSYELDVTMMKTIKPAELIQAGELITPDMLVEVDIPTVQHMKNAIVDINEIIGKRSKVPIGEMEEILAWKIGPDTLYPDKDETYLGFKVDFVGAVNNMVRRGDKVDVYVEYTVPKLLTDSGEILDQTILDANNHLSGTPESLPTIVGKVYNERLITGLTVAYVKDQEGKEIEDISAAVSFGLSLNGSNRDAFNMERYRQNATNQPAYITFIINDEQYSLIAEGQKEGTLKFGLPLTNETIGTIVTEGEKNNTGIEEEDAQ